MGQAQADAFNSKVEALAEAIESLTIAIAADALQKVTEQSHREIDDALRVSRSEVRESLRGFLRPLLRVLEPTTYDDATYPKETQVVCGFCHKNRPCRTASGSCQYWAAAVRASVDAQSDDPEAA